MTVKVLNKQTLLDLAIQTYGKAEALFTIAIANNKSITDDLTTGSELTITTSNNKDVDIVNFYKNRNIKPATAAINLPFQISGIGIMAIENNIKPFIVS